MDLLFTFHLGQIDSGSNIGVFSKLHVSIFKAHIDGSTGTSISTIFKIWDDEAIKMLSPNLTTDTGEMTIEDHGFTAFGFEACFQSRRFKHGSEISNPKIEPSHWD
jgi:hypothetical protein